jgi:D-aspartate ligase
MRGGEQKRVAAVVVGGTDNCGGLGVVRSLGQADVPVIAIDSTAAAPALHSRHARGVVVPALSGPALVRELFNLHATLGERSVLFLTSDDAALTVSEFRADLARAFRFRLPSHECLTALMDKNSFEARARELKFPLPPSVRIRSLDDLASLDELSPPVVVKPSVKTEQYVAHQFARGYRVASIGDAIAVCRRILPVLPDVIVQEWIDGPDNELYFCLQYRGRLGTTSFTGRKLSIWPPEVGTTASCTAAREYHAELTALTDAFFDATSFTGMGSMEFKRDARSGRFYMIEPTVGRVDWQEEVATLNGANIPLAAYLDELGETLPASSAGRPVIWRDGARHWKAMRAGPGAASTVGEPAVDAYWRLSDPAPALFHAFTSLARTSGRMIERLRKAKTGRPTVQSRDKVTG